MPAGSSGGGFILRSSRQLCQPYWLVGSSVLASIGAPRPNNRARCSKYCLSAAWIVPPLIGASPICIILAEILSSRGCLRLFNCIARQHTPHQVLLNRSLFLLIVVRNRPHRFSGTSGTSGCHESVYFTSSYLAHISIDLTCLADD